MVELLLLEGAQKDQKDRFFGGNFASGRDRAVPFDEDSCRMTLASGLMVNVHFFLGGGKVGSAVTRGSPVLIHIWFIYIYTGDVQNPITGFYQAMISWQNFGIVPGRHRKQNRPLSELS